MENTYITGLLLGAMLALFFLNWLKQRKAIIDMENEMRAWRKQRDEEDRQLKVIRSSWETELKDFSSKMHKLNQKYPTE